MNYSQEEFFSLGVSIFQIWIGSNLIVNSLEIFPLKYIYALSEVESSVSNDGF